MKKMTAFVLSAAILAMAGCGNQQKENEKVIKLYAPAEVAYGTAVEIKGTFIYKQYKQAGAPGVDPALMQRAYYFAVIPDTPFNAVPSKDGAGQPQYNITIMQVEDNHSVNMMQFKDKKVRIKGIIHEGLARVNYTRVVINPSDITAL